MERLLFRILKSGYGAGPVFIIIVIVAYIGFKILGANWDYFEDRTQNLIFAIVGAIIGIVLLGILIVTSINGDA